MSVHLRVQRAQNQGCLDGVCKILGFRRSFLTNTQNSKPHTHIKQLSTPDEQKVYIYMECLVDFDNTIDILLEQEGISGDLVDNFLIYCIYKTVHTQVELFQKSGIVHCDIKSDNVMLRKIHSDEPVEYTCENGNAFLGSFNVTFTSVVNDDVIAPSD